MLAAASYAAAQARVRARRSRLLGAERWSQLLNAQNLPELVELLRDTPYALAVSADPITFERTLTWRLTHETRSLTSSLPEGARGVVSWYARRFEVQNLKTVLRAIHHHIPRKQVLEVLQRHDHRTPQPENMAIEWEELLAAGSIEALLDRLHDHPYARPLKHALERYRQEQQLFYLEVALDLFYFQRLVSRIYRLSGTDRRQASRLLGSWIAAQNLLWAYRYLSSGMKPEEILNYTLHRAFSVDLATLRRIALGAPPPVTAGSLGLELPTTLPEEEALALLERLADRDLQRKAERVFSGSLFHLGGVLAYLILLEGEIRDLLTLAEARTYGLGKGELPEYLLREP